MSQLVSTGEILCMGRDVLIVGLGKTGIATADFMHKKGFNVTCCDNDAKFMPQSDVYRNISVIEAEKLLHIDFIIISPSIATVHNPHPIVSAACNKNIPIITDLDLMQYYFTNRIIGITGTNGKSTTSAMVHFILKECGLNVGIGGNIGTAMLMLDNHQYETIILELSSYQLENVKTISLQNTAILNIASDHIQHHGSMENYIKAKERIFSDRNGAKILNYDNNITNNISQKYSDVTLFSIKNILSRGISIINNAVYRDGCKIGYTQPHYNLSGSHNMENIAAALAICSHEGVDLNMAMIAVNKFTGLSHRNERIKNIGNIIFVNDSKATNAHATSMALNLHQNIYLIAGGVSKNDGFNCLRGLIHKVIKVFLIGSAQDDFAKELENLIPYEKCYTMDSAILAAYKNAIQASKNYPNSIFTILLSPLCASCDQYHDFEERGEHFVKLIQEL